MPNTRTLQRSFAGGELSPEMYGRIDDTKYQTGAAKMRNFIATPQGPTKNRPGFAVVREIKDSTKKSRLIPFTFSTTQTLTIELGAGYFRFHTQGATLLAGSPAAWSSATAYTRSQIVSYSGQNYYCILANTNQTPPNATYWYQLPSNAYEIPNPYAEADLFDIHYVQSADVMTFVHPSYPPRELRRLGATQWDLAVINFAAPLPAPTGVTATRYIPASANVNADTYETHRYKVTAVLANSAGESEPSAVASVDNNIFVTGAKNTISWTAVPGADRYYIYKETGGVYGYIGNTQTTSIDDVNIGPDFGQTPPIYDPVFQSAGNYPSAVSYFEQRRCFAGTNNEPQKLVMSKSGTESNFSYGIPIRDDDRISFRVAARESNTIRHIVPLTEMLLLTGSTEWRVTSVNSDAITPTSISVRPQSYVGASNVQPVIINSSMIYEASRGGHLREFGYNWQANGFISADVSIRAAHLFDGYQIVDMSYMKAPIPIVWAVSTSGNLIGVTYVPEQAIGSIHWHDTDGVFESCTVVSEGDIDALYVIVKRVINGQTKRFVERMATRKIDALEESFFVDCGSTYRGQNTTATTITVSGGTAWDRSEILTVTASAPLFTFPGTSDINDVLEIKDANHNKYRMRIVAVTSTTVATIQVDKQLPVGFRNTAITNWSFARNSISGLSYLEGKTVSILADGAVHPARTVTGGSISLDRAYSIVHVGLPYQSDLQTLPIAMQIDGLGQGRYKAVNHAWLRVYQSSGIFIGPNENALVETKQRKAEPYGTPPSLKSEEIRIMLTPKWQDSGQVYVRQSAPLPLTIVGLTLEVAIGG